MAVGRNDSCHCGSGRKFKNCCAGKRRTSRGLQILLVTMVALAVAGAVAFATDKGDPATATRRLTPQPAPAAPGKVWSAEHGHWHDATGAEPAARRATTPSVPVRPSQSKPGSPQPGPAPEGQVWSTEHGHWHKAETP